MASKPIMLLGNLASILLSIIGLLQYISWTIAGALILAILSITTLFPATNPIFRPSGPSSNKRMGGHSAAEKLPHERTVDRPPTRPHQTGPGPESRQTIRNEAPRSTSQPRSEFERTIAPTFTPSRTIPATVSPAKPGPAAPRNPRQGLRAIPPQIQPSVQNALRSTTTKTDPSMKIIGEGDYGTYDLQLDRGFEVKCDVSANAPVNVYILNQENLTGLDLGEEFWSETGEESITRAILTFVAPENGKWFLVVQNPDNKEVSATVNIRKSRARASEKTN